MKLHYNELKKIAKMTKFVDDTKLPILGTVLFKPDPHSGWIKVTATNLESTITTQIENLDPSDPLTESVCLERYELDEITRDKESDDATITIVQDGKHNMQATASNGFTCRICKLDPNDYPDIPIIPQDSFVALVHGDELLQHIEAIKYSADTPNNDSSIYAYTCLLTAQSNSIEFAATNSHTIQISKLAVKTHAELSAIIPTGDALVAFLKRVEKTAVNIIAGSLPPITKDAKPRNYIMLEAATAKLTLLCADGEYPDLRLTLQEMNNTQKCVLSLKNAKEIVKAMKKLNKANREKYKNTKLTNKDGKLCLDIANSKQVLDIDLDLPFEFTINGNYLVALLSSLNSDGFLRIAPEELTPIYFTTDTQTMMLMPMRPWVIHR